MSSHQKRASSFRVRREHLVTAVYLRQEAARSSPYRSKDCSPGESRWSPCQSQCIVTRHVRANMVCLSRTSSAQSQFVVARENTPVHSRLHAVFSRVGRCHCHQTVT